MSVSTSVSRRCIGAVCPGINAPRGPAREILIENFTRLAHREKCEDFFTKVATGGSAPRHRTPPDAWRRHAGFAQIAWGDAELAGGRAEPIGGMAEPSGARPVAAFGGRSAPYRRRARCAALDAFWSCRRARRGGGTRGARRRAAADRLG